MSTQTRFHGAAPAESNTGSNAVRRAVGRFVSATQIKFLLLLTAVLFLYVLSRDLVDIAVRHGGLYLTFTDDEQIRRLLRRVVWLFAVPLLVWITARCYGKPDFWRLLWPRALPLAALALLPFFIRKDAGLLLVSAGVAIVLWLCALIRSKRRQVICVLALSGLVVVLRLLTFHAWLPKSPFSDDDQYAEQRQLLSLLEAQYSLPAGLLDAVWEQESGRGRFMLSRAGAQGHFQFMPATAKVYGLANPGEFEQSAIAAAQMYSDLLSLYNGNLTKALAAYNWGAGNVSKKGIKRLPGETRNYVASIKMKMAAYRATQVSLPPGKKYALYVAFMGRQRAASLVRNIYERIAAV